MYSGATVASQAAPHCGWSHRQVGTRPHRRKDGKNYQMSSRWEYCVLRHGQVHFYRHNKRTRKVTFTPKHCAQAIALLGTCAWEMLAATFDSRQQSYHFKRPSAEGRATDDAADALLVPLSPLRETLRSGSRSPTTNAALLLCPNVCVGIVPSTNTRRGGGQMPLGESV